ncbi:ornithine cyclodeaminase [Sinorhizobium kostiense]|uniref:Ornithine cyclodeaminase n=1 Tax=Sinorhizobium kostiense TaxID=76747 RepID=A0ABS4R0S0_9HYPH|nr:MULTISPECIES: tyramine oxidase subunit B [Sinorhizobium]MBP2236495.1 ornithine cyclodeaminase [Sinorhizobium kostiense]
MYPRIDFLYLSEPDMIAAGVLDAERCVTVCEETFSLLGEGDYLMGGANHNSHGLNIVFPKETKFPNMPVAGPDRRFAAMPGYLGGRFDVCGNKWYGSNHANASKGLPRSVLTMMLNDKDTGAPLALMSANLLSAARTGGVPGVAAKHLANADSKVVSVIGCGPINKACFSAIMTQLKAVEKVVCFDIFLDKANEFAAWVKETYNVEAMGVDDAEAGFRGADVVTVAASRLKPLFFNDEWIKEGATILVSGPFNTEESFLTTAKIVYDHTALQEAYVEDAVASGNKDAYYSGVIGGPFFRLIDAGKLPALHDSTGLGDVVNGKKPGRETPKDRVIFIACGMAVFDISWGYECYQTALKNGIGQSLNLWEKPSQA